MNISSGLRIGATALLLLATSACDNDDESRSRAPTTLQQFAIDDISNRTSDTALPIEINDLDIDLSSEDPSDYDELLQPG